MSNPSSWFGIHAQDLDRAKAFYESVFGKPLQDIGGNGFRFIIFPADYTQHSTAGMIWHNSNAHAREPLLMMPMTSAILSTSPRM